MLAFERLAHLDDTGWHLQIFVHGGMPLCEHVGMRSVLVVALLGLPAVAHAHIHLEVPLSRTDDSVGNPQKNQHCGTAVAGRTARVTTYLPGATIMVRWAETIQHPGYFRIAFQPEGEVFRIPAASNGQAVVGGVPQASNFPTEDMTGMVDAGTGSMILKDRIPDGTLMTMITLPNMECANCTLQFIQMMTNAPPYTIDAASDDIYFNCADITLAANAPDAGVQALPDASIEEPINPGFDPGRVSGGCSTGGLAGWPAALALAGLAGRRRRRRA